MTQTINLYAADGCWLYKDEQDPNVRDFLKSVTIPSAECLPYWHECTDPQRRDWEEQHPDPSPEPEPTDVPANEGKEAEV